MLRHKVTILGGVLTLSALFCGPLFAQEEADAEDEQQTQQESQTSQGQTGQVNLSTTITGNQEQPKVAYIVPWQSVNDSELENQTIQSQLDIVFGHIEPVELKRELEYTKQLTETAD